MNSKTWKRFASTALLGLVVFLYSCHDEKSWMYKQWHNTLAHYNTYFNAEQKWLETVQATREAYKEDFRKPIELFNYGPLEGLVANQSAMDEVVKKASTMIDRHPKSKWVDDAYHLMGKAYLMKGDANAALDLFDYIFNQYKNPEMQYLSKLWSVRALLLKGKTEDAEALAQSLLVNKELPSKLLPLAQFTLGAIYHKQKKYKQSAELLTAALPHLHDRMDKYRTYFALGQSYQNMEQWEKAEKYYAKIPRFNPPYEISFNAQISRVEILSANQGNYLKANRILHEMLKDDKNLEYLGQIYYRIAKNEFNAGRIPQAIEKYRTSVAFSKSDPTQKTTSYLAIGDIYFNQKSYERAGKYYDSANKFLDEKHPDFAAIVAKNEILGDLLKYLLKVSQNDSLLKMATDKDWRNSKIKEALQREKSEQERQKNAAAAPKDNSPGSGIPGAGFTGNLPGLPDMNGGNSGGSSFPFYTMNQRSAGEKSFQQIWGKRENRDFWNINSKKVASTASTGTGSSGATGSDTSTANASSNDAKAKAEKEMADTQQLVGVPKELRRFYTPLPLSKTKQDENEKETQEALFKTAGIYQNKLNEIPQCLSYYAQLVTRFPKCEFAPQAYYELVKLNRNAGDYSEADKWKAEFIKYYPESIYLKMIDNPNLQKPENTDKANVGHEIVTLYDSMVNAYSKGHFDVAKKIKLSADKQFAGNAIQPRFDFVYAVCCAKLNDPKAEGYFEQVAADYPGTDVGERARLIVESNKRKRDLAARPLDTAKTSVANNGAFEKHNGKSELLCLIVIPKGVNINMLKAGVSDLNKKEFQLEKMIVTTSMPIGSKVIIAIENFSSPDKAKFYQQFLSKQNDFFASKGVFEFETVWITLNNYQTLVKNMSLSDYMQAFKEGKI